LQAGEFSSILKLPWYAFGVLGLHGKVLVAGGLQDVFCEKLLETSHTSDRANASQLQDGPAAGQGQAHQRRG